MESGVYLFTGKRVKIVSLFDDIHRACAAYRCQGRPDLQITSDAREIQRERTELRRQRERLGLLSLEFTDGYCEFSAIHRLLVEALVWDSVLMMHASCVAVDGRAYLFTATSGTGKSTHARYWREYFGERAVVLNDDSPLLKVSEAGATAYGSPWCGKHGLNANRSAPVQGICLLERSEENFIEPVRPRDVFPILYRQCYHLMDREATLKVLSLVDVLSRSSKIYRLGVNMSPEAARVAYEGMNKGR